MPPMISRKGLDFARDGAQHVEGVLDAAALHAMDLLLGKVPAGRPGIRLYGVADLRPTLTASGVIGKIAAKMIGPDCRPVRALLFDKTKATNWALAWHQDRTIAVEARREVPGFGPWSVKDGVFHVEPPFALLAGMVTMRVHLDAVPMTNAPLLIAPGSHRIGRIPEPKVPNVVARCGSLACCAQAGDVWLYATPILHASEAAAEPRRRRVLQVDYAVGELPGGLSWLGV